MNDINKTYLQSKQIFSILNPLIDEATDSFIAYIESLNSNADIHLQELLLANRNYRLHEFQKKKEEIWTTISENKLKA